MSVKIRLSRVGRKHVPFCRLVAIDSRKKRDGEVLDTIGTFDAVNTKVIQFNQELYDSWISKGALPTDSAKKVYRLYKRGAQGQTAEVKIGKPSKPKAQEKVQAKTASVKTASVKTAPVETASAKAQEAAKVTAPEQEKK